MKKHKFLIMVIVVAMLVVSIAGCETTATDDTQDDQQATKDAEELKGEITLWGGAHLTNVSEIVLEKFLEENPGVSITYEKYPFSEYPTKMRLQLSTGEADPNVMIIHDFLTDQFIKAGWLEDISSYLPKDDLLPTNYNVTRGDKIYGTTMQLAYLAFYFRVDIFEELNIKVPTNSTEYIAASETLAENGYFIDAYSVNDDAVYKYMQFLGMAGGSIFDSNGEVVLDSGDKAVNALKMIEEINNTGTFSLDSAYEAYWTAINAGKIVALFAPTHSAAYFETKLDPNGDGGYGSWRMVDPPKFFEDGLENYLADAQYYVMNSKAPNKDLAWKVIEYLSCSVEGGLEFTQINREGTMAKIVNGYKPSLEQIAEDSPQWEEFGGQKILSDIANIFLTAKDVATADISYADSRTSEAKQILNDELIRFFAGEQSEEDTIAKATELIKALE